MIKTLKIYNKYQNYIQYVVGDNCNLMKSIANALNVPLFRCASHRFNLAVEKFISSNFEDEINKLHGPMKKLNTLKSRAKLRKLTPLAPIIYIKKLDGIENIGR